MPNSLVYLGEYQTRTRPIWLPVGHYDMDITDTWEMPIAPTALLPYKDATIDDPSLADHLPSNTIELPGNAFNTISNIQESNNTLKTISNFLSYIKGFC